MCTTVRTSVMTLNDNAEEPATTINYFFPVKSKDGVDFKLSCQRVCHDNNLYVHLGKIKSDLFKHINVRDDIEPFCSCKNTSFRTKLACLYS